MNRLRFKSCLLFGWAELRLWLKNPRMLLLGALFVYINTYLIGPMVRAAESLGERLAILEPFISISNRTLLLLLFPLCFIVLMADFPRMDADTTFRTFRVGRLNWLCGQIVMLLLSSLFYVCVVCLFCLIITAAQGCDFTVYWSGAVTYATQYVIQSGAMVEFLPPNIYFQLTAPQAFWLTALLLWLYCVQVGLLLLAGTLCGLKKPAILLAAAAAVVGTVTVQLDTGLQWLFPTAHFVVAQHFTEYFSRPRMEPFLSVAYFVGLGLIFFLIALRRVRSYHFLLHNEV